MFDGLTWDETEFIAKWLQAMPADERRTFEQQPEGDRLAAVQAKLRERTAGPPKFSSKPPDLPRFVPPPLPKERAELPPIVSISNEPSRIDSRSDELQRRVAECSRCGAELVEAPIASMGRSQKGRYCPNCGWKSHELI